MFEIFIVLTLLGLIVGIAWSVITESSIPEPQNPHDTDLDIVEHENYWREDRY